MKILRLNAGSADQGAEIRTNIPFAGELALEVHGCLSLPHTSLARYVVLHCMNGSDPFAYPVLIYFLNLYFKWRRIAVRLCPLIPSPFLSASTRSFCWLRLAVLHLTCRSCPPLYSRPFFDSYDSAVYLLTVVGA
jgi:hypothetical protein